MPEEEARPMLRLIEERIKTSDIEVRHRDLLIRLRDMIEDDLTSARNEPERPPPQRGTGQPEPSESDES